MLVTVLQQLKDSVTFGEKLGAFDYYYGALNRDFQAHNAGSDDSNGF
jgi:hypothetical protein